MSQLGMSLSEKDIHAMMRSVGVGPHGKISYPGIEYFYGNSSNEIHVCIAQRKKLSNLLVLARKIGMVLSIWQIL